MNYLLSQTSGRNGDLYIVLSNDEAIYSVPNFNNTHEYQDDYKLEVDQWFVLRNFSDKEYCPDLFKNDFDNTAYSNLPRDVYPKIAFMVAVQENIFCVQKVVRSMVLNKSFINLRLNQEPEVLKSEYTIVINEEADAYYDRLNDCLYFKRLSSLTSIFDGIYELYKESTSEETRDFLALDILDVSDEYGVEDVKTANRRRIKAAMEKYNRFTNEQKARLPEYLQGYVRDVAYENGRFKINSESDLTILLNCFNQRYYTTEIDGEKRLANSVTPL